MISFTPSPKLSQRDRGFTLIEMAIVLVILGALLAGLITPLSTQRDANNRKQALRQLEEIRDSLLGYAQANGALPCPASAGSNGVAQRVIATGVCSSPNGFVPYVTLGVSGSIQSGQIRDPWFQPIHYRLTSVNAWQYAASTIPLTGAAAPNFQICSANTCTAPTEIIATSVVAVIFSTGPDFNTPTPPQTLNLSGGNNFVSKTPDAQFDDIVVWIAQPELIFSLSKAR